MKPPPRCTALGRVESELGRHERVPANYTPWCSTHVGAGVAASKVLVDVSMGAGVVVVDIPQTPEDDLRGA